MSPARPRAPAALAFALGAAALTALVWRFAFVCDDAYISFRYSRHLAEGHGLVYNLGESPPVEGYSNFLWVLWIALFERLGVAPELAACATSAACAGLVLALVLAYVRRRFELHAGALAVVALALGSAPPFALWATSGLETMPFVLFSFLAFERLAVDPERPRGIQAGIAALVAALLRADGALFAGAFLLLGGCEWLALRSRVLLRQTLLALAILVAGLGLHLVWRWSYHHDLLPNTAYVKAGFSLLRLARGLRYVAVFLLTVPAAWIVFGAGALWGAREERLERLRCVAAVLLVVALAVWVGGDFMPMGRYLVPATPFLAVLGAAALARLWPEPRVHAPRALTGAGAIVALQLLGAADVQLAPTSWLTALHFRWNDAQWRSEVDVWRRMNVRVDSWRLVGRTLERYTEPGQSIVLPTIGAIGYYTELTIYDTFGLVTPEVAHAPRRPTRASPGHDRWVDPEYFLKKKPDYLGAWLEHQDAGEDAGVAALGARLLASGEAVLERRPLLEPVGDFELRYLHLVWPEPPRKP